MILLSGQILKHLRQFTQASLSIWAICGVMLLVLFRLLDGESSGLTLNILGGISSYEYGLSVFNSAIIVKYPISA
jgi:hypothetical protein